MDSEGSNERSATLRQLAHDLKNPLTAVQVLADMLREDVPPGLSGDVDDLIEALDVAVVMADGLSNLARMEAGVESPAVPEDADLEVLVRRVASRAAFRRVVDVGTGSGEAWVDPFVVARVLASVFVNGRRMVGGHRRLKVHVGGSCVHIFHPGLSLGAEQQASLTSLYGGPALRSQNIRASALGLGYADRMLRSANGCLEIQSDERGLRVSLVFPEDET